MVSTYLQLVNFALVRLNEVPMTSSNFASAVSVQLAMKNAVNDAINDIENSETEWPFNFSTATITTTANSTTVNTYALASDYASVDWDSFFLRPSSTLWTGTPLRYINYDTWRAKYKATDKQVMNDGVGWDKPIFVFQTADNPTTVGVSPVPDQAYVIEYDYWKVPTALSAATDTHTIPARFEHVITEGIMYYAYMFRDNVTEADKAKAKRDEGIAAMRRELINRQADMTTGQIPTGGGVRRVG